MDFRNPLLIPTARPPGYAGDVPLSNNVIADTQAYYAQRPVYGPASMISATGLYREHVTAAVAFYTERPHDNQYDRTVVWKGDTHGQSRAPLGMDLASQRNRTFGGVSPSYYLNVAAPSLSEVAQFMGGVMPHGR